MTEEVIQQDNAIPASESVQEQEVRPEVSGSESGAEQTSQSETSDASPGEKAEGTEKTDPEAHKKTPWYQKRINEITREKYEAIEQAKRLEMMIDSLRNSASTDYQQQGYQQPVDVERVIAERLATERQAQSFNDACNKTYAKGKEEFPDFDAALSNFQMLGGAPTHLIEAANEMDGGHRVMHYLGSHLDEAAELLSLPPVKLAVRMAEIKDSLGRKKTTHVSKAPPPIKPLDASTKGEIDYSKSSLDDFMARRNAEKPIKR